MFFAQGLAVNQPEITETFGAAEAVRKGNIIRLCDQNVTGRYFGDVPICEFANVRDRSKRLLYSAGQFFNECDGGFSNTSPVGSFPPNGFGLYDMIGNVWEWVEDCWKFSYTDAPSDGAAREEEPCKARVRRGASWNTTERFGYTVLTRAPGKPEWRWETIGFRIARDYPIPAAAQGQ